MAGPEFFQTVLGRRFYDGDVPRIVKALERIAVALEKIVEYEEIDRRFATGRGPRRPPNEPA